MRVYIANAMTGKPNYNFEWFDRARDFLLGLGHDPVSPADMDRDVGFDGHGEAPAAMTLASCLRRDFAVIVTCDAIAFGPDWATSRGARAERQVGQHVGCQFWRVDPDARTFYREVYVGLSGYARSGKDTVAQILVEDHGFEQHSFAAPLKGILKALDPKLGSTRRLSSVLAWHGWEGAKRDPEVRALLQRLGTEAGRKHLGDSIWVDTLFRTPSSGRVAVSDCRFRNEADAIRAHGGIVVRVNRPGVTAVNAHVSEHDLDDYEFDAHLDNDGSIDELRVRVKELATTLA